MVNLFNRFLDKFICFLFTIGIFSIIAFFILLIIYGVSLDDHGKDCDMVKFSKEWLKKTIILSFICINISIFIPDSKTLSVMYLLPKIASNEIVKDIPEKLLKVLDNKLDEYVKDIVTDNNKSE